MASIALLPAELISTLRSSFVITSPASCVEELVQNALDAGATSIDVALDMAALSVRVSDNGSGIRSQDIAHIGQRYWTSKCHAAGDLHRIASYGFRGEALASMAEAALLEVVSRHRDSAQTFSALIRGGQRVFCGSSMAKRPTHGTTVAVRDLFFKWPVKRKELTANPHAALEEARRALEAIALIHPLVSFALVDAGRPSRDSRLLTARKTDEYVVARWRSIWGADLVKNVDYLDQSKSGWQLDGFFSHAASHSKAHQLIYVNNRYLSPCALHRAVNARFSLSSFAQNAESGARASYLTPSPAKKRHEKNATRSPRKSVVRQPVYLLMLQVPPEELDLMLEPSKKIVFVKKEDEVVAWLNELTDAFLKKHGHLKGASRKRARPASSSPPAADASLKRSRRHAQPEQPECCSEADHDYLQPPEGMFVDRSALRREGQEAEEKPAWVEEALQDYRNPVFPTAARLVTAVELDDELPKRTMAVQAPMPVQAETLQREDLGKVRYVAQVDRKFLLCRNGDRLILIDQHAADERVRVERFLADLLRPGDIEATQIDQQILLSYTEARQLQDCAVDFARWGVVIEAPEVGEVSEEAFQARITAIPSVVAERCHEEPRLLSELVKRHLVHIEEKGSKSRIGNKRFLGDCPKILVELVNSKACRGAWMFGDVLRDEQAVRIISQLAETALPFQCAHGRPSMLPIATIANGAAWQDPCIDWTGLARN